MAYINRQGYLEMRTRSGNSSGNLSAKRVWFFVKYSWKGKPCISIGKQLVICPEDLIGQRICLKVVKYENHLDLKQGEK